MGPLPLASPRLNKLVNLISAKLSRHIIHECSCVCLRSSARMRHWIRRLENVLTQLLPWQASSILITLFLFLGAVVCVTLLDRLRGDQISTPHNVLNEWGMRPAMVVSRYIRQQIMKNKWMWFFIGAQHYLHYCFPLRPILIVLISLLIHNSCCSSNFFWTSWSWLVHDHVLSRVEHRLIEELKPPVDESAKLTPKARGKTWQLVKTDTAR